MPFWRRPPEEPDHGALIERTAGMIRDPRAQALVRPHGLEILSLTWEDTARFEGSAIGPNISDMTIQVTRQGAADATCMPVIRPPNFRDGSGDLELDDFFLLVGNERGAPLRRIGLRDYLGDLRAHLTDPSSWSGDGRSLLCARDTHVLVSAQACFLPVPPEGLAEFNPVVFNYQSVRGSAAVLAILVTREGTSATIVDNDRDGFFEGMRRGQRLYFNNNGHKAPFTGQRITDFVAAAPGGATPDALAAARALGLNTVLLIQVPLKHDNAFLEPLATVTGAYDFVCADEDSDVEEAVIGHGADRGPYVEIDGQAIERDDRFPIRVTVQFYKATSNGALSGADAAEIAAQIARVYAEADYVGSLVTDGDMGRPTAWK